MHLNILEDHRWPINKIKFYVHKYSFITQIHFNKKCVQAVKGYELINQTIKTKNIITREFKKIYDYKFFIKRLKTGNDC